MSLNFISKASSMDKGVQTYLCI